MALPLLTSPAEGEQYRFHFDMSVCIGCKCCEVACNEQNDNPADIRWRRVGEIEGGEFPFTKRFHLSMGCNHCVDAACLHGCPVDAYTKSPTNGLVLHNADACIGCQYCVWNCPYGVPQYNEERGVVGKCDMCVGRLEEGRQPACAAACPEGAIQIEVVNIAEWKQVFTQQANAPGMPPAEDTISTTRITLPKNAPVLSRGDSNSVRRESAHWPLVAFLVLSQLSVGGMFFGQGWLAYVLGMLGLSASLLHLGRPIYAYRALKMWRRSWLSREVLFFTLFAGAALVSHQLAAAIGLAGVYASARIYMVPARPSWNSLRTLISFLATTALLGLALAAHPAAVWVALITVAIEVERALWLRNSTEFELHQSGRLLRTELQGILALRIILLAGVFLPYALIPLAISEIIGRYLFFSSVVPRNMAATFSAGAA